MLTQPSVLPAAMHHGTRVVYTELKGPSRSRLSHVQILSSTPPTHQSTTPPLPHLFTDTELFILQFPISLREVQIIRITCFVSVVTLNSLIYWSIYYTGLFKRIFTEYLKIFVSNTEPVINKKRKYFSPDAKRKLI